MVFDILFKLARKLLTAGLYSRITRVFGRRTLYSRIETYASIYHHYLEKGLIFSEKKVVEIGCGRQFFTALYFITAGAKQVILVEPKLELDPILLKQQIQIFNNHTNSKIDIAEAQSKIRVFPNLLDVPEDYSSGIDIICSYTVLEHILHLDKVFAKSWLLLVEGGIAYHFVDLTDHTYHIFGKFKAGQSLMQLRALFHLRYSSKFFNLINDPKCFMNRILLPAYLTLVKENGLQITELQYHPHKKKPSIHPSLTSIKLEPREQEYLSAENFSLKVKKYAVNLVDRG